MQVYSYVMTIIRNSSYAEEITQNTFFKAMTAKKQFKGNSSELTWLCGIAKHLAIDECRKNKKLSELDEAGAASIVDVEKAIEDKDTALRIHLILHELQKPYKNDVYVYFAEHKKQLTILSADFSDWSNHICFNANFYIIVLILGGIAGGGLLLYGIVDMKRKQLKK